MLSPGRITRNDLEAHGPSLKDVIGRYGELTGRPTVPPVWSFGTWYSRCMYRSRDQVVGIVERLRELDIPANVIHLDPLWQETRKTRTRDGMQFTWAEEEFGDEKSLVDWLAERPEDHSQRPQEREGLSRFLKDGRLPLHNNMSELPLRRQAVGRKNWLFVGSEDGAGLTFGPVDLALAVFDDGSIAAVSGSARP